ncbi:hypothetical protein [Streptomyces meridianus]|uniref:Uncharacterized protein n=1 Tax=Streptomyces meridianus TaxID=2938945 RepID=A0ABT0XDS3_9ACTN|nr:hypothetical protein [Streptomyces meridianus]MCM2580440.1 hypothetical protein [Streptomyces meridianus]
MTFPSTPLGHRVELRLGSEWVDVTGDAYVRDPISIRHGRADEGQAVSPASCSLTLNNRDGRYSPSNPLSPYYGLLGRNTPLRVSVPHGASYLVQDADNPDGLASTPDDPFFTVWNTLDVRCDVETNWLDPTANAVIVQRWAYETDDRSWAVQLLDGKLRLSWSTDGTSAASWVAYWNLDAFAFAPRQALRILWESDDGTGQTAISLYTADSLAGPWLHRSTLTATAPGTETMFDATAPLQIGATAPHVDPPQTPITGRVYAVEVHVDGIEVAAPDFTTQDPGTTAFTDGAGHAWTVADGAEITNRRTRFMGEVSSWPARWDVSGSDVYVPITAAGILRRLGQGAKALESTLRRRITRSEAFAYWPLEDGKDTVKAYSLLAGVEPARILGLDFEADDTLDGSAALPKLKPGALIQANVPRGDEGNWQVEFVCYVPEPIATDSVWFEVSDTGTGSLHRVVLLSAGSGVRVTSYNWEGTQLNSVLLDDDDLYGRWCRIRMTAVQDGSDVTVRTGIIPIGRGAPLGRFWFHTYAGTGGRVSRVTMQPGSAMAGVTIGHLGVIGDAPNLAFNDADHGYDETSAFSRIHRLCEEEGVPVTWVGDLTGTALMGPQGIAPLLDLLHDAEDTDGGLLQEDRGQVALRYRTRESVYNQPVRLALDYASGREVAPPLEPVDDDQALRNDVTVTREGGSSARAVLEDGPLSVQPPPDGVGTYDEAVTVNAGTDEQLPDMASWRLHLGTWPGARYPRVSVNLAAAPHLIDSVLDLELLDRLTISNPPPWLPPEAIDLLVQGYEERLGPYEWQVEYNCTPAGPWAVGVVEDDVHGRVDTAGAEIIRTAGPAATVLSVASDDGRPWTVDPADMPFDVTAAGEAVTVTSVAPYGADDFTRTVSNGWGTADSGHVWTPVGAATGDLSVNGTQGVITLQASPENLRYQQILETLEACELLVAVTPSQLAIGAAFLPGVMLRGAGTAYYWVRLALGTGGTVSVEVCSALTQIGASVLTPYTYGAGTKLWLRTRVVGHHVWARVWPDGQPEPNGWHADRVITTGTSAAGAVGLIACAYPTNTNASPALRFDGFRIVSPQTFTVTRGVNGITKTIPIGADVRLTHPAITAR